MPSYPPAHQVDLNQVMEVRGALLQAAGGNLWQPVDFNANAIGRAYGGDDEVNKALEQLLVPGTRNDQVCGIWGSAINTRIC